MSSPAPNFEGKVAMITGGGSGIGRASAQAFSAAGAKVLVADLDPIAGEACVADLRSRGGIALFVRTDVTRAEDVDHAVNLAMQTWGRLDCAHNNVGGGVSHLDLLDDTEAQWLRTLDLNLVSIWRCMKAQLPPMITAGGGAIVNTAAAAAFKVVDAAPVAYSVAKAGVVHLTRIAGVRYAAQGVRINAVSPGLTETPGATGSLQEHEIRQAATALHAIPRAGQPRELADAVLWLCSDAASFITGVTLPVDGGMVAK
ncbi:MAG: 3-oxoacyl-ACP reductase [Hydrocarboniphaga sp.]|uniref:SDR family oxidoreductase n=1 Tax=Hydrocarboniphaga sp. TaxID=2033016 RepID=UPI00260209A0|nr:SDR family oxidoreductase [Hydrocarboniphaga sp.]MDB5968008.1 3-oxoacyl-ACP reductase [Hydrocarboniphaga sp.]